MRETSTKGEQTRLAILETAIDLAAAQGLEGLTIGMLAERMKMSKSGVYAHCGSREDLQIAVLRAYETRFIDAVLRPALNRPRGLSRLRAIFANWISLTAAEAHHGCIMISGAAEYDDRPGPVRDVLVRMVQSWQAELTRAIEQVVACGDLPAETAAPAMVFDLQGIVLSLHHDARLLRSAHSVEHARAAFERLVAGYRSHVDRASPSAKGSRPAESMPAPDAARHTDDDADSGAKAALRSFRFPLN